MGNVNNLNGVPNFGHGFTEGDVVAITEAAIVETTLDRQVPSPTLHKSKVKSAAQKALGGRYK